MSSMDELLEAAKLKTISVWVTEKNKERFENGEIVVSQVSSFYRDSRDRDLVKLVIRASQCFSLYRNGHPYIRKEDWTWSEMDNFDPNTVSR